MNLKDLREDLGLTQQEIANTLNCTQRKVSHIENNTRKLNINDLAKLTEAYNISSDVLKELILNELKEKGQE